jgi:hypothetical protein
MLANQRLLPLNQSKTSCVLSPLLFITYMDYICKTFNLKANENMKELLFTDNQLLETLTRETLTRETLTRETLTRETLTRETLTRETLTSTQP